MNANFSMSPQPENQHLSVRFDAEKGIIRTVGKGFCNQQDSEKFLSSFKENLAKRRSFGPVRVLCDMRELGPQSGEIVGRMQSETQNLYHEGDRVAVLFSSILFKMQLDRSIADDRRRLFDSEDEALAWLASPPMHSQDPQVT